MSDLQIAMLLLAWAMKILELAGRAMNGQPVTDEEIQAAGQKWRDARSRWKAGN